MNGLDLLVDTNILIRFLNGEQRVHELILDNNIHLSFISEIELYSKAGLTAEQEAEIDGLVSGCIVLHYNEAMKHTVIQNRRTYKLKLPDAIIAATALYHKLPFFTFDTDFNTVESLTIFSLS